MRGHDELIVVNFLFWHFSGTIAMSMKHCNCQAKWKLEPKCAHAHIDYRICINYLRSFSCLENGLKKLAIARPMYVYVFGVPPSSTLPGTWKHNATQYIGNGKANWGHN